MSPGTTGGHPSSGTPCVQDGYRSRFDHWENRASVRSKPVHELVLEPDIGGRMFFPVELAPEAVHPLTVELPGATEVVLLHRLCDYLHFTAELEAALVIPVASDLARGRSGLSLPDAMRADAYKIVTDEAWHAQFSDALLRELVTRAGVREPQRAPAYQTRLQRVLGSIDASLGPAAELAFAIASETLISGMLATLPHDTRLPTAVRETVRNHAEDEGRHHAYFKCLLERFWPSLDRRQQRELGPVLPDVVRAFLDPDHAQIAASLRQVGLSPDEARQVVEDAYPPAVVRRATAVAAHSTVRYFEAVGALDDPETRESFERAALLDPS